MFLFSGEELEHDNSSLFAVFFPAELCDLHLLALDRCSCVPVDPLEVAYGNTYCFACSNSFDPDHWVLCEGVII